MPKFIIILVIALVFEAIGVVFLSGGLKQIGQPSRITAREVGQVIVRGATNKKILLGVFLEAVFFGALLYLLSQRDVSVIWPLTALGFVMTTLAAKIFLHEQVSGIRWAGVCLIVAGAALITWSDQMKEKKNAPAPTASADTSLR